SAAVFLKKDPRQTVERAGPEGRQRRVGCDHESCREKERQYLQHRDGGPSRASVKAKRGQPENEETGNEVAEEGEDTDTEFAVTKHLRAKINQPGDHRRMIEIADVEMAGIEPVVGFLRKKVGR